jgi:hypothetical protein
MFFLLRVAFWLTIVLALLPSGGAQQSAQASAQTKVGPTEAVVAAGAAVSDMGSFCERQPDACVVGAQAAVAIGQRAQAGAKMVYEFFNDHASHGTETGSVSNQSGVQCRTQTCGGSSHDSRLPGSQNTLKDGDLDAAWQGPVPVRTEQVPAAAQGAPPQGLIFPVLSRFLAVFLRPARPATLYRGHGTAVGRRDH